MITLNRHGISASIKDRYANITYCFDFENRNKHSVELKFEITIDPKAFISKFEADIDGELFIGKTKEKEQASNEYIAAKQKNENAILISQPHKNIQNVFQIKTNIHSKSKILLTIQIEQYLQKQFGFNKLNIQILRNFDKYNITPSFVYVSFKLDVEDNSGIYNVDIPKTSNIIIDQYIINKITTKCQINGKIMDKHSNELTLKYKIKGESAESHVLFDNKSNTFCHIISDIIKIENNALIPRRIIFVIDRSGSMTGSKWNKTISSTIMAIKQLRYGYDRFNIILFDSNIQLLPYKDIRGCILADAKNVFDSIEALQNENVGGSTNINDALLKAIELIKIDILLLNNDSNYEYNFFMNQIIFITDGEPNNGETNTSKIVTNVKNANDLSKIDTYNQKISVFSFGVGKDTNDSGWINDLNHSFLKLLSVNNNGLYQRIKESSAHTALSQYFNILSKPVLSNINIEYKNKNIKDLTQTKFDTLYAGNDLIICGKINKQNTNNCDNTLSLTISAITAKEIKENNKLITKPITISKQMTININPKNNNDNNNNTERIWAYLKLQQFALQKLIYYDMIEIDDDEKKEDESLPLSLALKYKFVTPWTSMIVVKKKDIESKQKPKTVERQKQSKPNEYQKYVSMKAQFDREDGVINDNQPKKQTFRYCYNNNDIEADEIDADISDSISVRQCHFDDAMKRVSPSNVRWKHIGGLEQTKKDMIEMVQYPIEYPEVYCKYGQSPSRGCLLWGPPGCGKTFMAKAIATECNANFISIKGTELLNEARVREVFHKARNSAPCILFFDELDGIASAGHPVFKELVTEMDGTNRAKQIFFIGASRRPDIIDSAIRRPGRLEQMVFIDLPDFTSRVSILKATLRKFRIDPSIDFECLAKQTHGYSGADLHCITKIAARLAIKSAIAEQQEKVDDNDQEDEVEMITMDMMLRAIKQTKRSVSTKEYEKYLSLKIQFDRQVGIIINDKQQQNIPNLTGDDDDDSDIYD